MFYFLNNLEGSNINPSNKKINKKMNSKRSQQTKQKLSSAKRSQQLLFFFLYILQFSH